MTGQRALSLLGAAAVLLGAVLAGHSAQAALVAVPETGAPGRLLLLSDHPGYLELTPGVPAYWRVDARLVGVEEATLGLELHAVDTLVEHPAGLAFVVERCPFPWEGPAGTAPMCPGGPETVAAHGPGSPTSARTDPRPSTREARPSHELRPLTAGEPAHLLVTLLVDPLGVATGDPSLMNLVGEVGLGLTAAGTAGAPPEPGGPGERSLPETGTDAVVLGLVAVGLLILGVGALLSAGRRG